MPIFDNFFNRRLQAPDKEKGSGGSASSLNLEKYQTLEVGQTWVVTNDEFGSLRIHIDSLDPISVSRYGSLYTDRLKFYEDISMLRKELAESGFELSLNKKKKKNGGADKDREQSSPAEAPQEAPAATEAALDPNSSLPNGEGNVSVVAGGSEVSASDDTGASVKIEVKGDTDGVSPAEAEDYVLPQELLMEGEKLKQMMDRFWGEAEDRMQTGWITPAEEVKFRKAFQESDEILKKVFTEFKDKKTSIDDAKKELRQVVANLPVTLMREEGDKGLKFFLQSAGGSQEAERIENIFGEAKATYTDSLPGKRMTREAKDFWKRNILRQLEKQIGDYMDELTVNDSKEKDPKRRFFLNRGAIREILSNVAYKEINPGK